MRAFDYALPYPALLTPEIVSLLSRIHEYKGMQIRLLETDKDTITHLTEIAKLQSTEASNRIEGICTSADRLKMLVMDKTTPRTRGENEIAGYRDVLNKICNEYEYIPLIPSEILQLHRDLYKYSGMGGGSYRSSDNVIEEKDAEGDKRIRFQSVPAWATPEAVEQACAAYSRALQNPQYDPLLVFPMFILDFLCIHPFNDGNGRMSRLLTLLLLYRSEYLVGQYISIEKIIEKTKEDYYDALQASSAGWHEQENDYTPFVRYTLRVILTAYRDFLERTKLLTAPKVSKPDRIAAIIRDTLGTITKSEIMARCPDTSQVTVQRALSDLLKTGQIIKIGGGRYTAYTWNRER